ncbi:MAG: hypothetical protein B6I28_00215 [Fusobacteriia bacterium 4572_132]|nr:MAG: hypothetical protein B6I28_00215 [Fusobacteriia bacterium 4572_132]
MEKIIGFILNKEEYALRIDNVKEIIKKIKMTRVPKTEKYIVGVINLRGVVIPIVDLNKKFKAAEVESNSQRIIIVEIDLMMIGIIVDEVSEVLEVAEEQIFINPSIKSTIKKEYVNGVCKLGEERLLTLLNIKKILEMKS